MKKTELQMEFQNTVALARSAVSLWSNDLHAANLMELAAQDIECLEKIEESGFNPDNLKEKAECMYKAVATFKLPNGCAQRDAARSIAHCLFAVWFAQRGDEKKALRALRDARYNAEAALRADS